MAHHSPYLECRRSPRNPPRNVPRLSLVRYATIDGDQIGLRASNTRVRASADTCGLVRLSIDDPRHVGLGDWGSRVQISPLRPDFLNKINTEFDHAVVRRTTRLQSVCRFVCGKLGAGPYVRSLA